MRYEDARSRIQSGDLLFWSHRSWKTWYDIKIQAVRIFTQSEYCHAAIAWPIAERVFILEAVMPKVRIYPLSAEVPFYHIPMGKPLSKEAEEFALSQVGEPYSQLRAMKAFFNMVPRGDHNEWECAQYACEVLRANGIDYGTAFTPSGLAQAALEDGRQLSFISK